MTSKEVVLTYEVLYEILRREKSREELQKLDEGFFNNVLAYLREKQQAYDENLAKKDIFSISEREKIQIQLQNIRKILRDLYDQRERKIILMALNKSRTQSNIVDTSNLLPEEKTFFESLVSIFDRHRKGILYKIVELKQPDIKLRPLPEEKNKQDEQNAKPVLEEEKEAENSSETKEEQPRTKTVKFVKDVEQFVGKELELYGPFETGDVAQLPVELANVLVSQGKAIEQNE